MRDRRYGREKMRTPFAWSILKAYPILDRLLCQIWQLDARKYEDTYKIELIWCWKFNHLILAP